MGDQRLSDADIGDILDNYLLQQNGNKRSPSPFDPSEALFGGDTFSALPSLWPHDTVVGFWRSALRPACVWRFTVLQRTSRWQVVWDGTAASRL